VAAESSLPHPAAILSRLGAQLDAYRFTYGLLKAAQRQGARIFDRTEVTRTQWDARGATLHTPRGRVRARHLVCATGYEADGWLVRPLTELRSTFAFVTEPVPALDGWPARGCLIWETADPYVYLRTTPDRRIIIGGGDEPFYDPARRDRLLARKTGSLQRRLRQWFPRIRAAVACAWAGTFARTEDGLPWIGQHPRNPRLWLALGYGGNGITFSLLAARLIRDGILGRPNPDGRLFGFERLAAGPLGRRAHPGVPKSSGP
jgi:glycine/D-amino acid oxidase-like deaminating enzyme